MIKSDIQKNSELIDQQLAKSGWNVMDPKQATANSGILALRGRNPYSPRPEVRAPAQIFVRAN